ncbi:MAG: hypothetical protein AAGA84_01610 [Pseudomonadota bacterium]
MFARKLTKFLHSVAGAGYAGGIAAYLALMTFAPEISTGADHMALRYGIAGLSKWIIIPSMLICLISGLLAMILHYPFMEMPWVWIKALSGVLVFEASLAAIDGPAQAAKRAYDKAADGEIDPATLQSLVHDEWMALTVLLLLALANIALAVWRPRFRRFIEIVSS